ncbi:MAG: hypothetical protein SFT81_01480 [Candidatus Caenarcaniphilales bacterium]|nr:hypothetical protein [Candidatus Caenarcaniphilales bacterium]
MLNIYIILTYYNNAEPNLTAKSQGKHKITNQQYNQNHVCEQIEKVLKYQQSALHWHRDLIENDFSTVLKKALESYAEIEKNSGITLHSHANLALFEQKIREDTNHFMNASQEMSKSAMKREIRTNHRLEYTENNSSKACIYLKNYLGGIYHLTCDEVFFEEDKLIIQESKNATGGCLPSMSDIKDGLFKLILYSNIDNLTLNDKAYEFVTRLKLTGKNLIGSILLPVEQSELKSFLNLNSQSLSEKQKKTISMLNREAESNQRLQIQVTTNRS